MKCVCVRRGGELKREKKRKRERKGNINEIRMRAKREPEGKRK